MTFRIVGLAAFNGPRLVLLSIVQSFFHLPPGPPHEPASSGPRTSFFHLPPIVLRVYLLLVAFWLLLFCMPLHVLIMALFLYDSSLFHLPYNDDTATNPISLPPYLPSPCASFPLRMTFPSDHDPASLLLNSSPFTFFGARLPLMAAEHRIGPRRKPQSLLVT